MKNVFKTKITKLNSAIARELGIWQRPGIWELESVPGMGSWNRSKFELRGQVRGLHRRCAGPQWRGARCRARDLVLLRGAGPAVRPVDCFRLQAFRSNGWNRSVRGEYLSCSSRRPALRCITFSESFRENLEGSCSAVSTPIFASEY